MMRVFISYRREDSSGQAGRLYDALSKQLGPENVFMDVDTIDIGVEFKEAIESAVGSCDVLFAMIGPRWLTVVDSLGERRLNREDDFVRLEIETALMRNIRVVPALVGGAIMPEATDLPGSLAPLARRNALDMADGPRWGYDVSRLMSLLERIRAGENQGEAAARLDKESANARPAARTEAADAPLPGDVTSAPAAPAPTPSVASTPPPAGAGAGGGQGGWDGGSGGRGPRSHDGGGRRSGGLSDAPRWLVALAGVGIVAVIALALLAAYQLGSDEPSGNANAGSSTPGTIANGTGTDGAGTTADRADVPAVADADQAALWLAIPKTIRRQACKFGTTEHAGGVATINCDFNDPKHGRTLVHLDRFIDDAHLDPIYKLHGPGEVLARGGNPDPKLKKATGGCGRTQWRGEGPWSHESSGGAVMGPVSGRYACYQSAGQCDLVKKMQLTDVSGTTCSVIVWTDLAAHMFVKAEQPSSVHAGIASFYAFWHHQFG
jgi:hypothetical protein